MTEEIIIPKVSVCIVTYNQEKYIRQCLQSIVDQETNFDFEVIVGDDASTDGTTDIVAEFAARYPDRVIPILHDKNIGGTQNYLSVHRLAKATYIAHCDGDDYFLPGKLQKQHDFLEADPKVNLVWHRMKIINPDDSITDDKEEKYIGKYISRSLLLKVAGSLGAHSSTMYRKPSVELNAPTGELLDFFFHVLNIGDKYAYIMGDFLGVYRKGIGFSSNENIFRIKLGHLEYFSRILPTERLAIRIGLLKLLVKMIVRKKSLTKPTAITLLRTFLTNK